MKEQLVRDLSESFFSILMGFVQNGLYLDDPGQLTMFFEGETDHKIPVLNALLCNSGLYTSVGRMIAHSFLHRGPPVYGLSPAVLEFWTRESISEAVTIEDVPDYDLRQALKEVHVLLLLLFTNFYVMFQSQLSVTYNIYYGQRWLDMALVLSGIYLKKVQVYSKSVYTFIMILHAHPMKTSL